MSDDFSKDAQKPPLDEEALAQDSEQHNGQDSGQGSITPPAPATDDSVPSASSPESAADWNSPWSSDENAWTGDAQPEADASGAGAPPDVPTDSLPVTNAAPEPPAQVQTASSASQDPPEEKPMTLMEHLGELRVRLVRCCIVVGLAFMACYSVADILFNELCRPLVAALPPGSKLIYTALPEAFFVYLQVGFVAAIFVASPYIFYQIWAFIAPGLYEEEKKYMLPMAGVSAFFFLAGAAFCFFVVFPFAFTFFVSFGNEDIAAMPSLKEYLGFALKLILAFGLIFEMPLFTFFLARMGMVTADLMRRVRRYAILVIFIVAAILTPPDVMSQLLMAIPMLFLYEFSIWVAVMFGRKKKGEEEEKTDSTADGGEKA